MPFRRLPTIREYRAEDERSWLRCRVLAFLDTCYYDDVKPARTTGNDIELVALRDGAVIGILDVEIAGELATIDTIAVHPDHRGTGIATALLVEARRRLPGVVTTLDAWTREDPAALAWYTARGFEESEHYLHVYKGHDEPAASWTAPESISPPVIAFAHAGIAHEAAMRERFARVYVCRRFSRAAQDRTVGAPVPAVHRAD